MERLRLIKSDTEIALIRRAARYADLGVQCLLGASYNGATVAEGLAQTRLVTTRIIREVDDWDPLTTKVTMATWAAPRSAQPHSIPDLCDRLSDGPHVALVLTRVNGYAAENERTYFTALPSPEIKEAFTAMTQARRIALDKPAASYAPAFLVGKWTVPSTIFSSKKDTAAKKCGCTEPGTALGWEIMKPPGWRRAAPMFWLRIW